MMTPDFTPHSVKVHHVNHPRFKINLLPICKDIRTPGGAIRRGFSCFPSHPGINVDDAFLAQLRCPIDPAREATLTRDEQQLVCSRCSVRFPVRQGLAVLIPSEGELPPGTREVSQLPCQRAANRQKNKK